MEMSVQIITSKRSTARFKVFDKNGNTLAGPTTYNSLFGPLTGTPCGASQNDGDPYALYDPLADRWVISDFAFPSFPGSSFYQCIAVSQTSDPVSGGWFLYALQVDPANPTFLGDYPKFGFWNSGGSPAQNAYFLTHERIQQQHHLQRRPRLMRSTAPACSLAAPPTRSGSQSPRPLWAIPIVWSLPPFARALRHLREKMNFSWLSTAQLPVA